MTPSKCYSCLAQINIKQSHIKERRKQKIMGKKKKQKKIKLMSSNTSKQLQQLFHSFPHITGQEVTPAIA